jgi:type I site-specific restriction endonuclease
MNGDFTLTGTRPADAPKVLTRWPLDEYFGEVRPEYRFAQAALQAMGLFKARYELDALKALDAADTASRWGTRAEKQAAIERLEALQADALAALGEIVADLLRESARATSEAGSAFQEISLEVAAWRDNTPPAVQARIREFADGWRIVMVQTSGRFESAATMYQTVLDTVQAAAQRRAALLAAVYDDYESELAAQRQRIEALKAERSLLDDAAANVRRALEDGLTATNRALGELGGALRSPLLLIGAGAAGALLLLLWMRR